MCCSISCLDPLWEQPYKPATSALFILDGAVAHRRGVPIDDTERDGVPDLYQFVLG
jgi:hypothetical protein